MPGQGSGHSLRRNLSWRAASPLTLLSQRPTEDSSDPAPRQLTGVALPSLSWALHTHAHAHAHGHPGLSLPESLGECGGQDGEAPRTGAKKTLASVHGPPLASARSWTHPKCHGAGAGGDGCLPPVEMWAGGAVYAGCCLLAQPPWQVWGGMLQPPASQCPGWGQKHVGK